jgi:hypothetical protein
MSSSVVALVFFVICLAGGLELAIAAVRLVVRLLKRTSTPRPSGSDIPSQ